jgi:hypothetical protein
VGEIRKGMVKCYDRCLEANEALIQKDAGLNLYGLVRTYLGRIQILEAQ